jgi:hypothetical protein
MTSEYEKFQQQMFEEMDELARASELREKDDEARLAWTHFVEAAQRVGVNLYDLNKLPPGEQSRKFLADVTEKILKLKSGDAESSR